MTNSQKILTRIMLYAAVAGAVSGLISVIIYFSNGHDDTVVQQAFGIFGGICAGVLVVTFFAFLISLVVSSSRGL